MKKILTFGDSILKGISLENGRYRTNTQNFISILGETLNVPIENKCQMGSTVMRLEKAMSRSSEALVNPDYDTIFLSYGGNDCDYDWQAVSDAPKATHYCKTVIEQFVQIYREKISLIKDMGKQVLLLSLPPIDAEKYFHWISKDRNAEAILGWLEGDVSHLMQWHEMFNLAVFQIGAATKTKVLDITSCFLSKPNYTRFLCEDGIHPNTEGHLLIADALTSQLYA